MMRAPAGFATLLLLLVVMPSTRVGADELAEPFHVPGADATVQELQIWALIEQDRFVKARDEAEKYLAEHPDSYVAHLSLATAHHYGEGNFPMALFHVSRALQLFEERFGPDPSKEQPWRWHAKMLILLDRTHGQLEHYDEQLAIMQRYNERYTPKLKAERAWPLMKKREFDLARQAARDGLSTEDPYQVERAMNALCTIEFEAGNDEEGYRMCREAVLIAKERFGQASAVDLSNFSEAARSVFKFDEAEQLLIESASVPLSWYGNPYLDLSDLYMRAGRFSEALSSLKEIPRHRARRPPHVQDADRNETRRSLAAFLVLMGKPAEAMQITDKALVLPDRRSHNSRDPEQDRAIVALVDRQARLMAAEMTLEGSLARPFYLRAWSHAKALWLRFEAWLSGRQAARFLHDDERLVGTFAIGRARSAVTPPWLVADLVAVLGPGVVQRAIEKASSEDHRDGASGYYDAVAAEVALAQGRYGAAIELAQRALQSLTPGDALLRERVRAVLGHAVSDPTAQVGIYEQVLDVDPGLFRRLGWALPARIESSGAEIDREVAVALRRSPRFEASEQGLRIRVHGGRACLFGASGTAWGCSTAEPVTEDSSLDYAQRVVDSFHAVVFSPRVDLSRIDINSLDGSNQTVRDPTQLLFGP